MKEYTVLSGQNIYDIAITLHGTVEGIFDLLISNPTLSITSQLSPGDILRYNPDFLVNQGVTTWFRNHDVNIKNGQHYLDSFMPSSAIMQYVHDNHPNVYDNIYEMDEDDRKSAINALTIPRIMVRQQGRISTIGLQLVEDTCMFIDWGDSTGIQFIESGGDEVIEHCYKDSGTHIMLIYGNFQCTKLDVREISGAYYLLDSVYAQTFLSYTSDTTINKLITQDL